MSTLLPSVIKSPPNRWKWSLGNSPNEEEIRNFSIPSLANAFGSADDVFQDMKVNLIFKGVTYESLSDPEFTEVAGKNILWLPKTPSALNTTEISSIREILVVSR